MARYVKDFSEGDKDQKDLLGGKGANLAEMTRLGLPVPPGFTITTEACRAYLRTGEVPPELRVEVTMAVRHLEDELGRRLGDFHDPLLVSVRSGAKFSMPGMMETVLNVGLNDASVQGLAELIFTRNLWAFELTSALLITAALGAMVLTHRERFERRKSQREMVVERFRDGSRATPMPNPGVFARRNAVDTPARLPDGSDAYESVSSIIRSEEPR